MLLYTLCYRSMVHALSLGDTYVMGIVGGFYSKEWARRVGDPSTPAGRPATVLVIWPAMDFVKQLKMFEGCS